MHTPAKSIGLAVALIASGLALKLSACAEQPAFNPVIIRDPQAFSPAQIPGLIRWYSAFEYGSVAEGTRIGLSGATPLSDQSARPEAYAATATSVGSPARLRVALATRSTALGIGGGQASGVPLLQFCSASQACVGLTDSSNLRVGSSYADFANRDLTIFVTLARGSNTPQPILINQSAGNNSGVFLGYRSDTVFRFSLVGPNSTPAGAGAPIVDAVVPGYSGTPTLELWTARLATLPTASGSAPETPGLTLYRNGDPAPIATNASVSTQQATATVYPNIGSQRGDYAAFRFALGDLLIFERALTRAEQTQVETYLASRYCVTTPSFNCATP